MGEPARGLLLFSYADKWIPELFIDASHPSADFLKQVFGKLLAAGQPVLIGDAWRKVSAAWIRSFIPPLRFSIAPATWSGSTRQQVPAFEFFGPRTANCAISISRNWNAP